MKYSVLRALSLILLKITFRQVFQYFRGICSHFFAVNGILQNFLAEIGKSKAILSRENIYGEYSTVVTLCLARYCLTCNDWCARGFVQKKLSCLCIHFPKHFPTFLTRKISITLKINGYYYILRKSIANAIKTLKISEHECFLGIHSNISKFIALLKGTTLKEMFQELFVWLFIIIQYVTYINNYFSRTIFILILNKLYLIVNSTIIIQKENVVK